MKTDKNTVIGFVLLGVLLFFYFWYTNQQNQAIIQLKKKEEDSLAKVAAARMKLQDTIPVFIIFEFYTFYLRTLIGESNFHQIVFDNL